MYAFLLLLGAVSTAAGVALVASAVAHEGAAGITPGTIAALGGLVLIGLGLVVRELQRIERSLSARPMPRAARPGEAPAADVPRIPFPPKPKLEPQTPDLRPQTMAPPAGGAPESAEQPAFETLSDTFPTLVRLDSALVVEETDVSLLPLPAARAEEVVGEVEARAAGGRINGVPTKAAPRLDVHSRPSAAPAAPARLKGATFDAFWPKGQRPRRDAQAAVHVVAQPPSSEPVQRGQAEAAPVAQPAPRLVASAPAATAPVTILKSGVVEGMAYTLYSDGSIEAQLPQGTLRFGSISELRNHIEAG